MGWNRKNKIEFFNSESSALDNFPIIESKNLKLKWVKRVREDFQNQIEEGTDKNPEFKHLSRCPGIFDLFKYGYIIPLLKDIIIKPKGKEFQFMYPDNVAHSSFGIDWQSTELIAKSPWSADFIIKIDTGWHVIAPKGVKFLLLPIAYPDTFTFTSTTGILDPSIATEINFQMYWNSTESETIIRAGTPLGHLIPLSEKKYDMVQRIMNQRYRVWLEKLNSLFTFTFWNYTIRKRTVDLYNQYWKR